MIWHDPVTIPATCTTTPVVTMTNIATRQVLRQLPNPVRFLFGTKRTHPAIRPVHDDAPGHPRRRLRRLAHGDDPSDWRHRTRAVVLGHPERRGGDGHVAAHPARRLLRHAGVRRQLGHERHQRKARHRQPVAHRRHRPEHQRREHGRQLPGQRDRRRPCLGPRVLGLPSQLDPFKQYFRQSYTLSYHDQTDPAQLSQPAGFNIDGVNATGTGVGDLITTMANHPRFALAWVQKLTSGRTRRPPTRPTPRSCGSPTRSSRATTTSRRSSASSSVAAGHVRVGDQDHGRTASSQHRAARPVLRDVVEPTRAARCLRHEHDGADLRADPAREPGAADAGRHLLSRLRAPVAADEPRPILPPERRGDVRPDREPGDRRQDRRDESLREHRPDHGDHGLREHRHGLATVGSAHRAGDPDPHQSLHDGPATSGIKATDALKSTFTLACIAPSSVIVGL